MFFIIASSFSIAHFLFFSSPGPYQATFPLIRYLFYLLSSTELFIIDQGFDVLIAFAKFLTGFMY